MTTSISGKKIASLVAITAAIFSAGYFAGRGTEHDVQPLQEGRYATSMKVADCVAAKTLNQIAQEEIDRGGVWQIEQLGRCANTQLGGIFEKDPTYSDSTRYEAADAAMWSVLSKFMDKAVYSQRLRQHAPEINYALTVRWATAAQQTEELKDYKERMLPNGPLGSQPVDRVANAFLLADCTLNFISTADDGKPSDALGYRTGSINVCTNKSIGVPAEMVGHIFDHDGRIESAFLDDFVDMDVYNEQFNKRYKEMLSWGMQKTEYPSVMNP